MRAIVITAHGGPEVLALQDRPDPVPGPFELLVSVEASALNRADLLQRRGLYPAPPGAPADIPGLELAGTVAAVGPHVTRFAVGDRVMAVVGGGAAATLAVVHEREALPIPAGLSATDAAAIPEAFLTAFDAAVLQGGLRSGQWLVVPAVASGVGTAAVQIARALGAHTVGSSRTAAKLARAVELGLDVAVEGPPEALVDAARAATRAAGKAGAAVVLDLVGGAATPALLKTLQPQGALILVGLMAGARAQLDLGRVLTRRLRVQGTVLRSRPIEQKIAAAQVFADQLLPLFRSPSPGAPPPLRPVVDRVLPLGQAAEAHGILERNESAGKVVLDHTA